MDADELYGLPMDHFVPARAALARELRSAGRGDEAAAVAALRKPSVAAWAVNQLVRTQARAMTRLYRAGDALRDAQAAVVGGRARPEALRGGAEAERTAVDELVQAAHGLLTTRGDSLSPTILERVSETLHAAALDDDARAMVKEGRLQRELRHVGFGIGLGAAASPPAPESGKPRPSSERSIARRSQADEREQRRRAQAHAAAEKAQAQARRRAERAAAALERAEGEHEQAERDHAQAQHALERARAALREAESTLEGARSEADSAEVELRQTTTDLDALG